MLRNLKAAASGAPLLCAGVAIPVRGQTVDATTTYNYTDAFTKSIMFYDANRCGTDVTGNSIFNWRGNCHIQDQSLTGVNMTGGYHDAGDFLTGLGSGGIALLNRAKTYGARIDRVNVMAMDYGDATAPNPNGQMGNYAIQTTQASYTNVQSVGFATTPLVNWANGTSWVTELSFWSTSRDNGSGGVNSTASDTYSGINQTTWYFTGLFQAYH